MVGTGAVACGVARVGGRLGGAIVYSRSASSAALAQERLDTHARVVTDLEALAGCTYVVEAIVEDREHKRELLGRLGAALPAGAVIASTTSSLSIEELAEASGRPSLFAGLHFFNPVERMELVELAFPSSAGEEVRSRTLALCEALGKTAIEVPDAPGFVVNRLLFPYLFDAVRLLERHSLAPATIDACMKLGAHHPMGPLSLLDLVGLDVAISIAESIDEPVPERVKELVAAGRLGRKTGAGFYEYSRGRP